MTVTYSNLSTGNNLATRQSLMDYLDGGTSSQDALQDAVDQATRASTLQTSFSEFNAELSGNKTEEFLEKIEKGQTPIDSEAIGNYLEFNRQKLAAELSDLAQKMDLNEDIQISFSSDGSMSISPDDNPRLQQYLEKDQKLASLLNQTAKLSKFNEWADATGYALELKEANANEADIQSFLTDARAAVTNDNIITFNKHAMALSTDGKTSDLIQAYEESKS